MPEKIADNIFCHRLANGLTVLAEPLEHVVSTAMILSVPMGASRDSEAQSGAAGVINEWIFRGAADRSSREISSRLDFLGCHRDETVGSETFTLSTSQTDRTLYDTMEVYADLLTKPTLSDESFGTCVDLAIQELDGLEDQPSQLCSLALREIFYPAPLNASPYGSKDGLKKLDANTARQHADKYLTPQQGILAVAGKFDLDELVSNVENYFGSWKGQTPEPVTLTASNEKIKFVEKPTSQVQLGLACDAPLAGSEDYYACRLGGMILSGGMSSRLFTEVREKRGLVYSIAARYRSNTKAAGIFVQAGTTPQRAQQTLEATLEQLKLLADGVSDEELTRAKTQLKAMLVMQSERTAARAMGLCDDWLRLGRTRTLEEVSAQIDAVTLDQVNAYLIANPMKNFKAVVIGPAELDCSIID